MITFSETVARVFFSILATKSTTIRRGGLFTPDREGGWTLLEWTFESPMVPSHVDCFSALSGKVDSHPIKERLSPGKALGLANTHQAWLKEAELALATNQD
jgi:hypothetical protein